MRILYVCPCWPGITEAYNEGKEPNGMPGFFYVLEELIRQENEIDLCIYTSKNVDFGENKMPLSHWFSKVKIVGNIKLHDYEKARRVIYELNILPVILNRYVTQLLNKKKYDFVYGQGNYADCARIAAKRYGIPFGLRKYGDDFAPLVKQCGLFMASLRSPVSALSYMTRKKFILATNDGTEIDKLAKRFSKKPPYEVYVWNNGFNHDINTDEEYRGAFANKFVLYCARIIREKGLRDVIEIYHLARQKGYHGDLVVAGSVDDDQYFRSVKKVITDYEIEPYIKILGKITSNQIKTLCQSSDAVILAGLNNNLNNALIESLGYGGIVIVRKTNLIDQIITHSINGFMFSDISACSDILVDLDNGKYDPDNIRLAAKQSCEIFFGSWNERAKREVDLLYTYGGNNIMNDDGGD